jgi:hypothetical protein
MRDRKPRRLSYANVAATIALVAAFGMGGAYAADKIGSKDIGKNAVKSKHIKDGQVKAKDAKKFIMAARAPGGDSCALNAQTGGITSTSNVANTCDVTFPRAVDDCIVQATPLHPNDDLAAAGVAGIRHLGGRTVRVTRRNNGDNFQDEGLFAIEAICP